MHQTCEALGEILSIDSNAVELGIKVAYSLSWGKPSRILDSSLLDPQVERLLGELKSRYALERLRSDPVVRAYRDFYWRIGIDPTKTRPSSEALVRRALRGRWPKISPLVDAGNIASARYMVPIGLYDADKFKPPARIAISQGGERFRPIGGGEEVLKRGVPILVDARGVVMHVYPHRDSVDTMIRDDTSKVLIVAAGVPGIDKDRLTAAVREVQQLYALLGWESCSSIYVKP
ncbi:MAG: phenylalanine--tRNA ligase beta subunit-related protein [Thermoproteota archaeon]